MNGRDIIHPRRRFSCITSVKRFKVAKFESTDGNVSKTSFPFGQPYKRLRRPPDSLNVTTRPIR